MLTADFDDPSWLEYDYGKNCGRENLPSLEAQKEIRDLYLIENKKSDIRIYSMNISTKPLLSAMSPDFFFRRTVDDYDPDSTDAEDVLTQIVSRTGSQDDVDKAYVDNEQWLQYLTATNSSPEEARQKYRLTVQKMAAMIAKITLIGMKYIPNFAAGDSFHTFGWDFILDNDLNPWWIETNTGPKRNKGFYHAASVQTAYEASFLDQLARGTARGDLSMETHNGKWFTPLIDMWQLDDKKKLFGFVDEECVGEFL